MSRTLSLPRRGRERVRDTNDPRPSENQGNGPADKTSLPGTDLFVCRGSQQEIALVLASRLDNSHWAEFVNSC